MAITPDSFVGIDIVPSIPKLDAYLRRLPPAVQDAVVDALAKKLIDILKTEQPTPRYVTRKAAYEGVTFFTDKQRRWFFAALDRGEIQVPYHRTQEMRNAWKQIGKGKQSIVANEAEGVEFVIGDEHQSRHEAMVGWKKIGATISKHTPTLEKTALGVAQRAIDKEPIPR